MDRQRVLFIATGPAARAQLAVGLLRGLGGERFAAAAASGGGAAADPLAARVLRELGLDPAGTPVAPLAHYLGQPVAQVITLCDGLAET